tara:strand:+ start:10713 stop:12674 length:1962 start_codon:yes stop_codon:yes gene_type:complete
MSKLNLLSSVKKFFKKDGVLSKSITNYSFRDIQSKMAIDIAESINNQTDIIIEAGTGVGKTFAYLVPALLSDKKIIISTGTKTLQDQLFKKDLPVINKLISNPKNVVLLKGRRNYLCKYRLEQVLIEDTFETKELAKDIKYILNWHDETKTGDISEVKKVNEKSLIWNKVTVGKDSCLNKDCPYFQNCFVMDIKKRAQNADVIIVNHHLLLSDWKLLKSETAFLPKADTIILDEAHQVPDLAYDYFGDYFSSLALKDFFKEIKFYIKNNTVDILGIDNIAMTVEAYLNNIFNILDAGNINKNNLQIVKKHEKFYQNLLNIKIELEKLNIILDANKDKNRDIETYFLRATDFLSVIKHFIVYCEVFKYDASKIYWYEIFNKNFSLNITPIDISVEYTEILNRLNVSMIYTSATLATNHTFDYFIKNLGLNNRNGLKTRIYDSPFDYKKQAILYSPRDLPNPDNSCYIEKLIEKILPILKETKGRAFLLFTSYKSLNIAADILEDEHPEFNLLIQGQMNKSDILKKFRSLDNCLLLGTSSFWEGVDIKGDALQCVVIDKLPFASPQDPITQGKIKYLRSQGKDPFAKLQCPMAAIALKQGAGRLIRDFDDYGVLVLADPRIVTKEYGGEFVNSLPNMKRTRDISKVIDFLGKYFI